MTKFVCYHRNFFLPAFIINEFGCTSKNFNKKCRIQIRILKKTNPQNESYESLNLHNKYFGSLVTNWIYTSNPNQSESNPLFGGICFKDSWRLIGFRFLIQFPHIFQRFNSWIWIKSTLLKALFREQHFKILFFWMDLKMNPAWLHILQYQNQDLWLSILNFTCSRILFINIHIEYMNKFRPKSFGTWNCQFSQL